MKTKVKKEKMLLSSKIGAAAGFVAFLVVGAIPALFFGGAMGLMMAASLFGAPVEPTLAARIMVGGGMLLGLAATLSLFLVIGSLVGTAVGAVARAIMVPISAHRAEHRSAHL